MYVQFVNKKVCALSIIAKRILNAYYYKHKFLFTRVCIQIVCVQKDCKYVGSNENVIMCGMINGKVCE